MTIEPTPMHTGDVTPGRTCRRLVAWLALASLAACSSALHRAPVEDRGVATRNGAAATPMAAASAPEVPVKLPPGAENAGKPGYYTVRAGDTLIRVGLENGQNWRDIQRWNNLDNPNSLEVGQVLRVAPPAPVVAVATPPLDPNAPTTRPVAPAGKVEGRPLGASGTTPLPATPTAPAAPAAPAALPGAATTAPPVSSSTAPAAAPVAREADDDIGWAWPAGQVIGTFDENRTKGLQIGGKQGDAVLSAADGRVVYAGSGLRGYGNLIIVKHNNTYLSAYAHNQSLLVKEDQVVRRGQKIAEMGSSDADRVQLHFEIRRQGKPVDPAKLLPSR
jgi:lipoprotein NlpD